MDDLLRFLKIYETWIYVVLGIAALVGLRNLIRAWEDWRGAVFGLERESALMRLRGALTLLVFVIGLALLEFITVSFVYPAATTLQPLPTPTVALLETPLAAPLTAPTAPTPAITATLLPATPAAEGCVPGQIEWTNPKNGGTLQGKVVLRGTVNVPNLGFYKYEYRAIGSEDWLTIAAGNRPIIDQPLGGEGSGEWDTEMVTPGDYELRLVVYDNTNQPFPACVISVRILAPDGG
ncbi:hypothetical protein [Thermanaerothrix sp.]|uniref:hypothetical protein n=1 Tax=Thermanaerothrix sp. TaxID=2972675 RepID=UPI003C7971B6